MRARWSRTLVAILVVGAAGCSNNGQGQAPAGPGVDVGAPVDVATDGTQADTQSPQDTGSTDPGGTTTADAKDAAQQLDTADVAKEHDTGDTSEPAPPLEGCVTDGTLPGWAVREEDGAFVAQVAEVELRVQPISAAIVRLRYVDGEPWCQRHYAVPEQAWPAVEVTWGVTGEALSVCTSELRLEVRPDGSLTAWDSSGVVVLEDGEGGGYSRGEGQYWEQTWPTRQVSRLTPAGERFYGFGEKTGALDKRGRKLELWNTDHPSYPVDQDPLYQSIPFFIGLRGLRAYGVFTDNTHRMHLDMAHTDPGRYTVAVFGGEIDQYLVAGPGIDEVVERYTSLTGRLPMLPRWTLGYHQCRWSYTPDTQVKEVCQAFRDKGVPADGIWLDIDYMDGFRSFTWHPTDFADPAGLSSDVGDLGFKLTAIIDPGLKLDPGWDVYQAGLAGEHFLMDPAGGPYRGVVWPGDSVFPDFTRAETRAWWGSLVPAMTDVGVQGLWLDMNEPASFQPENHHTVPPSVMADGDGCPASMAEVHNMYALTECWATWEGMLAAAPDKRPFLLTRAGYAGIQRYAAVWTGDASSNAAAMKDQVPMLTGLGLSGVPMVGSDVGGWEGNPEPWLYARWIQLGAISPFYRSHVQKENNGPTAQQDPWSFGEEVLDISRITIGLRYRLLPYWYSLMDLAARTGAPLLRPLVYEFQHDPRTHDRSYEAMVGPWLLFAPVLEKDATSRTLYLPAGRWMELRSGALFEGPGEISVSVTLQALPVFVREGAIVPMGPLMMWSDEKPIDPLTFELFPAPEESRFELYEDDGLSMEHLQGVFARRTYRLRRTATGAIFGAEALEGGFEVPARTLRVRIRRVDSIPTAVTLGGAPLAGKDSWAALEQAGRGWFWDSNDRALEILFLDPGQFELVADYDPSVDALSPPVQVSLRVTVPEGTPTDAPITVATDANGWTHQALEWVEGKPRVATGRVTVPRGEWFEYKYARGSWETVEKWVTDGVCKEALNRYHFGSAHPAKEDTVVTWADSWEQCF